MQDQADRSSPTQKAESAADALAAQAAALGVEPDSQSFSQVLSEDGGAESSAEEEELVAA